MRQLVGKLLGDNLVDSEKVNRWLTLGANFGVLIGLVFLVVELKQANDLAEASAYRARGEEIQSALQAIALSPDLAAIEIKAQKQGIAELSDIEVRRYQRWVEAALFRMQNQFNDYRLGYLNDDSYQAMLRTAASQYPRWIELGIPIDDREFRQAVEEAIARAEYGSH